ncbi:MAG: hypothetical protein HKO09_05265 [Croceitalea sp.]|nr:hypothetical protein [Croceitalea sp.]
MKKSFCTVCFTLFVFFGVQINAQEITAFSGMWGSEYYQDDQKITKQELKNLFATNKEVAMLWKKSEANATVGYVAMAGELGFAFWLGAELGKDNGDELVPAIGTVGTAIIAGIFLSKASKKGREAILTYNKQFDNRTSFRLIPTINKNGLGLALKF